MDLGNIQSTSSPVSWAVGFVRDPTISYTTSSGNTEQRSPYYVTQFSSIDDAVSDTPPRTDRSSSQCRWQIDAVTGDYAAALQRAMVLDQKIMGDASNVSSNYADLVILSARQTMASLDITVGRDSEGNPDASDIKVFMKDIGASGYAHVHCLECSSEV